MARQRIASNRIPAFTGLGLLLILATGGLDLAEAGTRELIKNGGFEKKGGLANWSVESSQRANAYFFPDEVGSTTPLNLLRTAKNPGGKKRYAIADQNDESYVIMIQKFKVPSNARRVILSFQMFADSFGEVVKNPDVFTLDEPNQQARVDLLEGDAKAKETGNGVVEQLYRKGADSVDSPKPPRYKRYRFNITRNVKPGRSYQIRFAVVAIEDNFLVGVDNVSVKAR